jgi:hypothetical protein
MFKDENWVIIDNQKIIQTDNYLIIESLKENLVKSNLIINKYKIKRGELIIYDFNYFMNDIYHSYKNNVDIIIQQAKIDIERSTVLINNKINTNFETIRTKIKNIARTDEEYYSILMFCTQASLAEPILYLSNKFNTFNNNILYIGEIKNQNHKLKKLKIKINEQTKKIKIRKLIRLFRVDKIYNDTTIKLILINIELDISNYIINYKWHFI